MTRLKPIPQSAGLDVRLRRYDVTPSGCWMWRGAVDANSGYGRIQHEGRCAYVHRLAYMTWVGPIPDGLQLDHLCRVRACLNPAHLEPVTPRENVRRGESPGAVALRRTHCLYGHAYADFGREYRGRRTCRLCNVEYLRAYKANGSRPPRRDYVDAGDQVAS